MKLKTNPKITGEDWITNWFVTRGKMKENSFADQRDALRQTDYFEAGWLTSMEVVELVTEIEQKFGMQFSERDLQDQRFSTIAGLADIILQRSRQTCESQ